MSHAKALFRPAASVAALVATLSGAAANAQDYPAGDPGRGYEQGAGSGAYDRGNVPEPGYGAPDRGYGAPDTGYDAGPPPGYDGSQPPPPPPGYAGGGYEPQPQDDQRYEAYAEDWAQRYCTRAPDNAGAGAVIGGLFGALLGSGLAGRHDRGGGAVLGGVAGAAGGAAIGSSSRNATSPGCPPGYVVRGGAPAFYYPAADPYLYAAPAWYRPWIFYGGRWTYRPYPYHAYYYRRYGYGRPYARPYRYRPY